LAAALLLLNLFVASSRTAAADGVITGTAVNGTSGETALAGAAVVLRASDDGAFVPVAETTTDAAGHFRFEGLPLDSRTIYLAGVNRAGVHYPGPRVRLDPARPAASVRLVAYDAIEGPSPLQCERHEIVVAAKEGYLEVSERLVVANRSRTAFIGMAESNGEPITFRLTLPQGFDKVTFDKEFHGRNFAILDGKLVTQLPWPPGSRELKFRYRLPVEKRRADFARSLDLPTEAMHVRFVGAEARRATCTLMRASVDQPNEAHFSNQGSSLAAGERVELHLLAAPIRFEAYARWTAVVLLALVIGGSAVAVIRSRTGFPPHRKSAALEGGRRRGSTRRDRQRSAVAHARPIKKSRRAPVTHERT
jgi:hypothetical protein